MGWPAVEWCLGETYDPRLRPWRLGLSMCSVFRRNGSPWLSIFLIRVVCSFELLGLKPLADFKFSVVLPSNR